MTKDVHDPETRSYNMSRIRGKDTKPEVKLRSLLHKAGFRFRIHDSRLPGKPDIVLPRYKSVIFVNGCFWHRHEGCRYCTTPATRKDFWDKKFSGTVERDRVKKQQLEETGWDVFIVWECELKHDAKTTVARLIEQIKKKL
jgi:DNA mismatch endonuclease (patch repair protein)